MVEAAEAIEIHDVILGIDLVIDAGDDLIVNGDVILIILLDVVNVHGIYCCLNRRDERLGSF